MCELFFALINTQKPFALNIRSLNTKNLHELNFLVICVNLELFSSDWHQAHCLGLVLINVH